MMLFFWLFQQRSVASVERIMVYSHHISQKLEPFGRTSSETRDLHDLSLLSNSSEI
jgi:hypothetical protein